MSRVNRKVGIVAVSAGMVVAVTAAPAFAGTPTPSSLKLNPTVIWSPVPATPENCVIANECPTWAWQVDGGLNLLLLQSGYVKGKKAAKQRARQSARTAAELFEPGVWATKKDSYTKGNKRHKTKIWTYTVTAGNDQGLVASARDLVYDRRGKLEKRSGVAMLVVLQEDRRLPSGLTNKNSKLLKKQMRKVIKGGAGSRLVGPVVWK